MYCYLMPSSGQGGALSHFVVQMNKQTSRADPQIDAAECPVLFFVQHKALKKGFFRVTLAR